MIDPLIIASLAIGLTLLTGLWFVSVIPRDKRSADALVSAHFKAFLLAGFVWTLGCTCYGIAVAGENMGPLFAIAGLSMVPSALWHTLWVVALAQLAWGIFDGVRYSRRTSA